jgi:hypothetical protein
LRHVGLSTYLEYHLVLFNRFSFFLTAHRRHRFALSALEQLFQKQNKLAWRQQAGNRTGSWLRETVTDWMRRIAAPQAQGGMTGSGRLARATHGTRMVRAASSLRLLG